MARPRKPTALKALEGTLRADRMVPNEMMPALLESVPSAPEYLNDRAKAEWYSVCSDLLDLGMLHRVDLALLSMYCQEVDNYLTANERLQSEGFTITFERNDGSEYSMPSPWVSIKNKSLDNALKIASQFGFTPSARTRISTNPSKSRDPFEDMLNMDKDE